MRIIRCAAGIYRYLHQPPPRGHATSSLPLGDKPRVALLRSTRRGAFVAKRRKNPSQQF